MRFPASPRTGLRTLALALALAWGTAGAQLADTPIYTIQGSGASSPFVGQSVSTTGVVTRLNSNGFFLQDLTGDGNPATSDGIFVFTSSAPTTAVGNLVRVTGTVTEFNPGTAGNADTSSKPLTQITGPSITLLGTGQTIAPTVVTLPLPAGQSFERYEGMLVTISGPLTVQQNFFQARFGQLTLGGGGRQFTPTNRFRPGTPAYQAYVDELARSRFLLDDGRTTQNPNPTPYIGSNGLPRGGDTVASVTGVMDFGLATASNAGFGLYRLHPTTTPSFSATNPRPAAPPAVGGNVRLAAMNVLNYFTTFTNGSNAAGQTGQVCTQGGSTPSAGLCRGANNITEFNRQRAKIVQALAGLDADAVGLMEIQNNGNVAAQNLVDALNAAVGAGTWAVVPDAPEGMGTDAIKVAMIYKPARLARVGASVSDPSPVNSRPTFAQTFQAANGERVTLVVNHLKSKGSCPSASDPDAPGNTDAGDGQSCWNALRVQQAQQLRSFVARLQASGGTNDVLLVGDFNAYAQEDPIYELTSNGYVDQLGRFDANAYSYVFDGLAGRLDHAIATASLSARVAGAVDWHINADESVAQDYNLEFKQPACSTCAPDPYDGSGPWRSSDHDPLLVGLNLYRTITGTTGRDTLTGTPGDDILVGGASADVMTGGAGRNRFAYNDLRDAGDTITDFVPGKDLLDLRGLLASIGANPDTVLAAGVVSVAASAHGAQLRLDLDGAAGPSAPRVVVTLSGVAAASLSLSRDLLLK